MIDFTSEAVRRDPFPCYEQLRAAAPVAHDPRTDAWLIPSYEGVRQVLGDEEYFSSSMSVAGRGNPDWLIFMDPPRHSQLRALIARAFTPRSIAALEPRIRELTGELLDAAVPRGEMDIVTDFSAPLPLMVIAEMLGVPRSDWPLYRRWSDVILRLSYTIGGGEEAIKAVEDCSVVWEEMRAYLAERSAERRSDPRDDLLTRLLQSDVDGERLTEEEILGFFQLLLIAGHETTTNLISNAILCLLEYPEQLARLRAAPDLLPSAIEETLRFRTPVQFLFRASRREVSVCGVGIPAGQLVMPLIGAANRDPGQFTDPNRFDVSREPNPHLAFGQGSHFCMGAPLTRLEARIALSELFGRVDALEPASDEPWEPRKALHVHGPTRFRIRFHPTASRSEVTCSNN